jgi:hypothetical protein
MIALFGLPGVVKVRDNSRQTAGKSFRKVKIPARSVFQLHTAFKDDVITIIKTGLLKFFQQKTFSLLDENSKVFISGFYRSFSFCCL